MRDFKAAACACTRCAWSAKMSALASSSCGPSVGLANGSSPIGAAGISARLISTFGFYAVIATVPIILIIFFTYWSYLKNIEASEAQAEVAQRHVEELSG